MGGVPGTSKGCNTCRKRKIRCDEGKPACDRCLRTGRDCAGYDRPANFNSRTGGARAKLANTNKSSTSSSTAPPQQPQSFVPVQPIEDFHINNDSFPPPSPPSTFDGHSPGAQLDLSLVPIAGFDPITPPIDAPAFDFSGDHLINTFLDVYYPSDSSLTRQDVNHAWVAEAAVLPNPGKAMPIALRALALSRLGFANCDEAMKAQSRNVYVTALSEFQKALWDEKERRKDRTLAAGRALTLYELYEATSFRGWNEHQCGFAGLLKMRGPESIKTNFTRSLLESFRNTMMYQSIGRREDTFLTTPAWRCAPDAEPSQLVNDIGLRIAKLLADIDVAKADPNSTSHTKTTLLARCVDFDMELDSVYARQLTDGTQLPLYWDSPAGGLYFKDAGQSVGDPRAPLDFRDLLTAQALINNWALKTLVIMNIGAICQSLSHIDMSVLPWTTATTSNAHEIIGLHSPTTTPLGNAIPSDTEPNIACKVRASQICRRLAVLMTRSAYYFTRIEKGLIGPAKCLFGLRIALMVLSKQGAPEASWCEKIYEQLGSEKGVGFAARLREQDVKDAWKNGAEGMAPNMDPRLGWLNSEKSDDWNKNE